MFIKFSELNSSSCQPRSLVAKDDGLWISEPAVPIPPFFEGLRFRYLSSLKGKQPVDVSSNLTGAMPFLFPEKEKP